MKRKYVYWMLSKKSVPPASPFPSLLDHFNSDLWSSLLLTMGRDCHATFQPSVVCHPLDSAIMKSQPCLFCSSSPQNICHAVFRLMPISWTVLATPGSFPIKIVAEAKPDVSIQSCDIEGTGNQTLVEPLGSIENIDVMPIVVQYGHIVCIAGVCDVVLLRSG